MSPEDSEKLREILLRAFDLPQPARAAFLDEACAGDAELRALADALLGARPGAAELAEAGPAVRDVPDGLRPRRLKVGELVDGKYRIEAPIGAGGMGEVYLARQLVLNRVVAIKVLPTGANAGSGKRFQREALAVGSLHHPNIVTVHDLGLAPGLGAYLVMEFVDGHSLADELSRRTRLPIPEAVELMRQVCAGVAAAHAAGMIHRDLKPGNILLGRAGEERRAKVADFGLAKLVEDDSPVESLTVTGALVGTPPYMSPEQCVGDELDARSDVYSLGCILYEMVAGVRPFTAPNQLALLRKHVSSPPTPLRDLAPGASAELEAVVARALAKKPDERWQTAAELGRALAALAAGAAPVGGTGAEATDDSVMTAVLAADSGTHAGAATPPTNVPEPATRCIGRERELERIASALRDPQVRLLTLTGAGGTGKTRLACEAARVLLPEFADGVFAVELAALADPLLVSSHVGGALGLREVPGVPPAEALGRHLADKRMLLVLDNFEHLVEAAPLLAGLLAGAPGVKLLVTSRALLHLSNEHEVVVDPLEVPPPSRLPALEVLSRMPAVALFVERAREAKPGFELTRANAAPVAEVCRRLDGLPLAIELAAARAKLLTPQAMLARLESRLKLLTGGARDLPGRQQTMRGALAWSYDLLDREERALLQRLAVFAGGCTLEAAEAVCGEEVDVLDGVASLVDKSLVRQRDEGGEPRFTMLGVVREFALEQLAASGGEQEARLAHARYFLALAEEIAPQVPGHDPGPALERLNSEHENVRAALAVLLEREPDSGARLAAAVAMYLRLTNRYTEGRGWLERALGAAAQPATRAEILSVLSYIVRVLGDRDTAIMYGEAAVDASRASGDRLILAKSLVALGAARNAPGNSFDIERARQYTEEALAAARDVGAPTLIAIALNNLGEFARVRRDYAAARDCYAECLETVGRHAVSPLNAIVLLNLGAVTYASADHAAAYGYFRESLETARSLFDDYTAANALDGLAALALEAGDAERAARVAGATEAIYEGLGVALDNNEQELRDQLVARLAEALGPAALEAESERGRAMGLDAAAAEALLPEHG